MMITIPIVDPDSSKPIADLEAHTVRGIPRFCAAGNYTDNFGLQWNRFAETQLIRSAGQADFNSRRFFATTAWKSEDLAGENILEVGSGAGRFSRVVLEETEASLYSVDYSSAVEANWSNNGAIAPDRFHLFQASIYEMPFADGSFDRTFCLGVLQHTPDFEKSVASLIAKTRPGGEIVVDFYEIRGWWTKLHAKYLLRPITKRMGHDRLLSLIEGNVDQLRRAYRTLERLKLRPLTRFLPVCDIAGTLPPGLTDQEQREWVILDTFDMFSPEFDNPQRISAVAQMFERHGADVAFAGNVDSGTGMGAVVRGVKR